MPAEHTIHDLIALSEEASRHHMSAATLERAVRDAKAQEAAAITRAGVESQLDYLAGVLGIDAVEDLVRDHGRR